MDRTIQTFIEALSSGAPIPGGGGASALVGAVSTALCSMVANLTLKQSMNSCDREVFEKILDRTQKSSVHLLELIQKDGEMFEPLSKAYHLPMEEPNRDQILEEALVSAASVPMEILEAVHGVIEILEELLIKGTKLAISDVGVAASTFRSTLESGAMNVFINTKLMKNREYASELEMKAKTLLTDGVSRCDIVYQSILKELVTD